MNSERIIEEIRQFVESNEVTKRISLDTLGPKERCQIYNTIETKYFNRIQCEKQSEFHGQHRRVVLVLTKITPDEQIEAQPIEINNELIDYFRKYTRSSLPITKFKYLQYVFELMDPYIHCQRMFTQFIQDIEAHENFQKFNIRINKILNRILQHLTEHPSTQIHKTNQYETEVNYVKSSIYKIHRSFYTKENQDKQFISLDINKADYTIMKHYHPEVFKNLSTWEEFVRSFSDDKPILTLINSKYLREKTFGDAGVTKKTKVLSEYFIHKTLHEMNIIPTDIAMLENDETVITYDPVVYRSMFERYHGTFFKVLAFRLVKLPKYDYYVKEYFDPNQPNEITHRELKCIPLPFIMQCIKQYEGKTITELDRKFTTESGHVATFDESIF